MLENSVMAPHDWALSYLEDVLIYQKKPNLTWHGIQKGEIQGYRKTSFQSLVHRHLSDRRVSLGWEHRDLSSLGLLAVCLPPMSLLAVGILPLFFVSGAVQPQLFILESRSELFGFAERNNHQRSKPPSC